MSAFVADVLEELLSQFLQIANYIRDLAVAMNKIPFLAEFSRKAKLEADTLTLYVPDRQRWSPRLCPASNRGIADRRRRAGGCQELRATLLLVPVGWHPYFFRPWASAPTVCR